eukprot:9337-Heterococcus_DN1.PRE.3
MLKSDSSQTQRQLRIHSKLARKVPCASTMHIVTDDCIIHIVNRAYMPIPRRFHRSCSRVSACCSTCAGLTVAGSGGLVPRMISASHAAACRCVLYAIVNSSNSISNSSTSLAAAAVVAVAVAPVSVLNSNSGCNSSGSRSV